MNEKYLLILYEKPLRFQYKTGSKTTTFVNSGSSCIKQNKGSRRDGMSLGGYQRNKLRVRSIDPIVE